MQKFDKEVARTRRLLARILRVAGLTRTQVDKRLHFGRGFATRVLTGTVELKHEHILMLLHVAEVDPEDFYRILYQRPEDRKSGGTLGRLLEKMTPFLDKETEAREPAEAMPAPVPVAGFDPEKWADMIAERFVQKMTPPPVPPVVKP